MSLFSSARRNAARLEEMRRQDLARQVIGPPPSQISPPSPPQMVGPPAPPGLGTPAPPGNLRPPQMVGPPAPPGNFTPNPTLPSPPQMVGPPAPPGLGTPQPQPVAPPQANLRPPGLGAPSAFDLQVQRLMQQRALQQRQPQQTPPPASPGLGTTNPVSPPGSIGHFGIDQYGRQFGDPDFGKPSTTLPKMIDGPGYIGGNLTPNPAMPQLRTFQDGGLASLIPPPLQNGPQFGMDQLSQFVGYPQQ
jgi:hypothetical protein